MMDHVRTNHVSDFTEYSPKYLRRQSFLENAYGVCSYQFINRTWTILGSANNQASQVPKRLQQSWFEGTWFRFLHDRPALTWDAFYPRLWQINIGENRSHPTIFIHQLVMRRQGVRNRHFQMNLKPRIVMRLMPIPQPIHEFGGL